MGEPRLLACASLEELYDGLKSLGFTLHQRDAEASHRLVLLATEARAAPATAAAPRSRRTPQP